MKRIVAIVFLSLLMLQAIPVLHFFSSRGAIFYTSIDEEKPGEIIKEKKGGNEYLSMETATEVPLVINTVYAPATGNHYAAPSLALLTPPPDASI